MGPATATPHTFGLGWTGTEDEQTTRLNGVDLRVWRHGDRWLWEARRDGTLVAGWDTMPGGHSYDAADHARNAAANVADPDGDWFLARVSHRGVVGQIGHWTISAGEDGSWYTTHLQAARGIGSPVRFDTRAQAEAAAARWSRTDRHVQEGIEDARRGRV